MITNKGVWLMWREKFLGDPQENEYLKVFSNFSIIHVVTEGGEQVITA